MPLVATNPSPLTKPTRFPNKQASQTLNSHALKTSAQHHREERDLAKQ